MTDDYRPSSIIINHDAVLSITIDDYHQAATNAKIAGFDGVEIHGGNGYLLDQFLQDSTNYRTDGYGGNFKNRSKFFLEVTDAVCDVWNPANVGVHIAPRCDQNSMGDSNPLKTFGYLLKELSKRKIAFILSRAHIGNDNLAGSLKKIFDGGYIINENLSKSTAEKNIIQGNADAAAWGQYFISNPNLVNCFLKNLPLKPPNENNFYFGGATGYTDL